MELRILGTIEALADGHRIRLRGARQLALIGLLAARANEAVSSYRLVDELWGSEEDGALPALRVRISQLRKTLGRWGERLETTPGGYLLRAADDEIDARRFERLARSGHDCLAAGFPEKASEALSAALGLWRGPALAGAGDYPTVRAEADRLDELRLLAVEDRVEAAILQGRHREAAAELEALTAEHPLRERLLELQMRALYQSGRQADALAVYHEGRRRLVEGLGIEPRPALRDLEQAILRHDRSVLDPSIPAVVRSRHPSSARLPAPISGFVGRRRELAELDESLVQRRESRLVTLVGPGGVGKTRLAIEVARRIADAYPAGATFVALAGVRDPASVLPSVARAAGLPEIAGLSTTEELAHRFGERDALVVLDNVEHVLAAGADIAELLALAPALTVLATSREPLRISGERQFAVHPLEAEEAVELYLERTLAAGERLERTAIVDELCARLDRLPLALELAAARSKVLTTDQLVGRLGERLDLLAGGPNADRRQQTLRATLQWSYDLLTAHEQRLLACLSVFAGDWTLEAAEEVCAARVSELASLVEKSLIRRNGRRFSMLETIRQYARERLAESGEEPEIVQRFVDRMLQPIERAMPESGPPAFAEVARYDGELDNLRAALEHVVEHDPGRLATRALALFFALELQGLFRERFEWIDRLIDAATEIDDATRARLLCVKATSFQVAGELETARRTAETALALAAPDDLLTVAQARFALVTNTFLEGNVELAIVLADEVVELARRLGDPVPIAVALDRAGFMRWFAGDPDAARQLLFEALEVRRRAGVPELFDVVTDAGLGSIALEDGDAGAALRHFRRTIATTRARGYAGPLGLPLLGAALALLRSGDTERAALLFGFIEANHHAAEIEIVPQAATYREELADAIQESDAARAAMRNGAMLSREDAVALALADGETDRRHVNVT